MLKPSEAAILMDCVPSTIRRKILGGKLHASQVLNAQNRPEYAIPLSALPHEAQIRYYEQRGLRVAEKAAAGEPAKTRPNKPAARQPSRKPLDSYTEAEREEIRFWRDLIARWEDYRSQPGQPLGVLDGRFVQHMKVEDPDLALSVSTLYRKKRALDEDDLDHVIEQRGKARRGRSELREDVREIFNYYYLEDGKDGRAYPVTQCIEYTERWAKKHAPDALPFPSYSTFYRAAMSIPVAVRVLKREGLRAYYNKVSVYTRRDYESIDSNDWWVGDTYTCDVMTIGPDGKTHRPSLTAWVDVRSGIFVGWHIFFDGNKSQYTIYALRNGCLAHGMPNNNLYTDNGREYLTYDFGGRGHRAKKVLADGSLPFKPKTIVDYMGLEITNAVVQNSRAKLVERSFLDVKESIMRLFPTYTGGGPEEKPEALKKNLKRGKIPTDEEFRQKVDLLISGYLNYQPYYGSVPEDKGKRRIDVYNEHLTHLRKVDEDVLNLMMLRTSKPKTVTRNGVMLNIRGKKLWFNSEELHARYFDEKVYVRYNPDDLSKVRVYNEQQAFLLEAPRDGMDAIYGETQEEIARQQQVKARFKRMVLETAQTFLPDASPEDALALLTEFAEENLAGPTARKRPKTVELVQPPDEPLPVAVGEMDIFRMNRNMLNGGTDDEYDEY